MVSFNSVSLISCFFICRLSFWPNLPIASTTRWDRSIFLSLCCPLSKHRNLDNIKMTTKKFEGSKQQLYANYRAEVLPSPFLIKFILDYLKVDTLLVMMYSLGGPTTKASGDHLSSTRHNHLKHLLRLAIYRRPIIPIIVSSFLN